MLDRGGGDPGPRHADRQGGPLILLALGACLDELLDAPYILQSGIGPSTSFTIEAGAFRVATDKGVVQVGADAVVQPLDPGPVVAVDGPFVLRSDRLEWPGGSLPHSGAVDLADRGDGALLLFPDRLEWWPKERPKETLATGLVDARAVANIAAGHVVVVCADRVFDTVDPHTPLVSGLVDARAAASDGQGRLYVVQGQPSELYRVDGGGLALVARHIGDVRDLRFGAGGPIPSENIYLLRAEGQIDYLRPP